MYRSEWLDIILIASFGQGLFLCFMLWRKKHNNRKAVGYLVSALGMVLFLLLGRATFQPSFVKEFAEIILLPDAILFLVGPLIYFFILALLRKAYPSKIPIILHYVPALIHILFVNTIVGLNIKGVWQFLTSEHIHGVMIILEALGIASFTGYTIAAYQAYQKYKEDYYEKYATPFLGRFLRPIFLLSSGISIFWFAGYIYNHTLPEPNYISYVIVWFLLCTIVFYIAFQIWNHPELLQLPEIRPVPSKADSYSEGELETLLQFMQEQKPYLDQEIKLAKLASELNIPKHELSKIINEGVGKNFFDFINIYRVEEFIRLREDEKNKHYNILELAYQSGFNSKSAFNRAFRKATGHSPSAYFQKKA